jgi:uncharacterized glyoxalase superfamily protein PhnB
MLVTFNSVDDLLACYEMMKDGSITVDSFKSASCAELGGQFIDRLGVRWAFMVETEA